jgi:hypothetical protein
VLQSWSIVEYLRVPDAAGDQPNRVGAFLSDPLSKTNPEDSFKLHFGLGYGRCSTAGGSGCSIKG